MVPEPHRSSGFHSSPPHEYSEYLVLYHGLHGHGEYVEHQPDASKHDEQRLKKRPSGERGRTSSYPTVVMVSTVM